MIVAELIAELFHVPIPSVRKVEDASRPLPGIIKEKIPIFGKI